MKTNRHFNFLIPLVLAFIVLFTCITVCCVVDKSNETFATATAQEDLWEEIEEETFDFLVLPNFARSPLFALLPSSNRSEPHLVTQVLSAVATRAQIGWQMPLRI